MEAKYQLIKIENPFKRDRQTSSAELVGDMTILDLYCDKFPDAPEVVISVNGKVISLCDWDKVYIKGGDQIIVAPDIQGDDDKNPIATVLMIVVTVVAAYLTYGTSLYAEGAWLAGYGAYAGYIGAGALIAGSMLVNAIAPPPSKDLPSMDLLNTGRSQVYSWNPQTVQEQGIVVPRIYGLNKVYGNIIVAFIDAVDAHYYASVLICLGYGPLNKIYDYKINNQLIQDANYSTTGIEVIVRKGLLNQDVVSRFNNTKIEFVQANGLLQYGQYFQFTTENNDFDGLEIELNVPRGLYFINGQGAFESYTVPITVEIKRQGDSNWTHLATEYVEVDVTFTEGSRWSRGYWQLSKTHDEDDVTRVKVWHELEEGSTNYADHLEGDVIYNSDGYITSIWRWMSLGSKYVTQQLNQCSLIGSSNQLITKTFLLPDLTRGYYDIRITRLTANVNDTRYGDAIYCSKITEVYYDDFRYPRMALVGIKSLATEEISGSLQFSCLVEGLLVRVYNSVTGIWSVIYSNNPAWVCYDILTQPVFNDDYSVNRYDGYNPTSIDYLKFSEWADWCDTLVAGGEKRITFNGVFDSQFDTWTAAWKVAETGRAALVWNGTTITVIVDKATTETQLFTIGNIGIDSFKESFLSDDERAGEIEVDFINSERDYERDKYTLVSSAINKPNNKTTIQLMGITKTSEAWRAAKFKLLCNQYLTRTIEFNVDVDAIACTVGDVIRVGHSVPQWGYGGRIVSATSTTVTLDQEVTLAVGTNYEICIRLSDDTIVEKSIGMSPGTYSTLSIGGTFSTIPAKDDIFTFGVVNISYKPFRVIRMSKSGDQQVSITAVEYDENIYTGDTDSPTVPTINYSALDPYVHVTEINLSTEASVDNSDAMRVKILVNWRTSTNTIYGGAATYLREKLSDGTWGRWRNEKFVRNSLFSVIENVVIGRTYEVGINCWSFTNIPSPASEMKTKQIVVENIPNFYSEYLKRRVNGVSIKDHPNEDEFDGTNCTITWNAITSVDNSVGAGEEEMGAGYRGPNKWFKDYEVSIYSTAGTLLSKHYTTDTFFTYTLTQNSLDNSGIPVSSFAFEVKARTRLLTVSESATRLTVTNTSPAYVGGLTSEAYEDGVTFSWTKNTENDLRGYLIRTAFAPSAYGNYRDWSDWFEIPKNTYSRDLTTLEKELQGWGSANIQIEVKSIDVFGNSSVLTATKVEQCQNQKIDIAVSPTSVLGTFTDILSAVNQLPSGGGKIYIKVGEYDSPLINLPNKHLDIEGQSKTGVIVRNTAGQDLFKMLDVTAGFSFKNFTIQSVNTSVFSKMFNIYGTLVTTNLASVEFENIVFNLKDENLTTTGDVGIFCYKTKNNSYTIKSCDFNDGRYGFQGETIYPYKLLFSTNLCIKQKSASVYGNALELEILNNIIKDIMYRGLDFLPPTLPLISLAKITGNSLSGFSGALLGGTWTALGVQATRGEITRNSITLDSTDSTNSITGLYTSPSGTDEYTIANNPIDLKSALGIGTIVGLYHGGINSAVTSNPIKINAPSATYRRGITISFNAFLGGGGQNNTINDNPINMVNSGAADIGILLDSSTDNNKGFNAIQNAGTKVRNLGLSGNKINITDSGTW